MNISNMYTARSYIRYPHTLREPLIQQSRIIQQSRASQSGISAPNDTKSLRAKLLAGQELTASEMEYLRKHDPDLYDKALKTARDREAYKSSLSRSKTKNDVLQLYNQTLTRISREAKYSDSDEAMMRVNMIQDAQRKFVQSEEYASLP